MDANKLKKEFPKECEVLEEQLIEINLDEFIKGNMDFSIEYLKMIRRIGIEKYKEKLNQILKKTCVGKGKEEVRKKMFCYTLLNFRRQKYSNSIKLFIEILEKYCTGAEEETKKLITYLKFSISEGSHEWGDYLGTIEREANRKK